MPSVFLVEVGKSPTIIGSLIITVFAILVFNISGVSVTKYINALARSLGDVARTLFVWIFGIIVTLLFAEKYPNYDWELTNLLGILL